MHYRLDIKGWRFYIALTYSQRVRGIHSLQKSGKHILMWDFDNKAEDDVRLALLQVQKHFKLPRIFLLNTGLSGYYHAYCFSLHSWADALHIIASTEGIDQMFFKIGVIRGYFTLRYSPKRGRDFEAAIILPSQYKEDVNPFEMSYEGNYWTKRL